MANPCLPSGASLSLCEMRIIVPDSCVNDYNTYQGLYDDNLYKIPGLSYTLYKWQANCDYHYTSVSSLTVTLEANKNFHFLSMNVIAYLIITTY
jgi:hypothetical protein